MKSQGCAIAARKIYIPKQSETASKCESCCNFQNLGHPECKPQKKRERGHLQEYPKNKKVTSKQNKHFTFPFLKELIMKNSLLEAN